MSGNSQLETQGTPMNETTPILFFATPPEWRQWLAENHDKMTELWVGYYKKGTGKPSITWPESVAEALCYGWIDGLRKTIDDTSYKIRFTPRRTDSNWSAVNVKMVAELTAEGRMEPAGIRAFAARKPDKTGIYSYEQERPTLDEAFLAVLQANPAAWAFFQAQPAGYQRAVGHWVMEAKREETRMKRLATLIEDSSRGRTVASFTRPR